MSVRLKIALASLCGFLVTLALGLYATSVERRLGEVSVRVFDEATLSINHARAAQARLAALHGEVAA
jgi:hypothetical protein